MKSDDVVPSPAPKRKSFFKPARQGFVWTALAGSIFVVWPQPWLFEIISWLAEKWIDPSQLALMMMVALGGAAVALFLGRRASFYTRGRFDKYLSTLFKLSARAFGAWVAICALTVVERWPTRLEAALLLDLVMVAAFLALSALVAWGLRTREPQPDAAAAKVDGLSGKTSA